MFPQHPSQSTEMLRRMLVESSIKQENAGDRREQAVLDGGQRVENVDGPIDEVAAAGRNSVGGYSWDSVIADAMLSTAAAPAVHQGGFRRQYMLAAPSALGTDSDSEVAHELALSPHDLEEDVNDEADQSEMLGLNIDHDSSGNDLLTGLRAM